VIVTISQYDEDAGNASHWNRLKKLVFGESVDFASRDITSLMEELGGVRHVVRVDIEADTIGELYEVLRYLFFSRGTEQALIYEEKRKKVEEFLEQINVEKTGKKSIVQHHEVWIIGSSLQLK